VSNFINTKERLEIVEAVQGGAELMLTRGYNRKISVSFKSGKSINQDVALDMLKKGMLVPVGNDGLFAGCAQTLGLSAAYIKQLEGVKGK
jgi:hypothetical protein